MKVTPFWIDGNFITRKKSEMNLLLDSKRRSEDMRERGYAKISYNQRQKKMTIKKRHSKKGDKIN